MTVMQVGLINTATGDVIDTGFIDAKSHREAINLELSGFFGVEMTTMDKIKDPEFVPGGNPVWRHVYLCGIPDEEYEREVLIVLYSSYKIDYGAKDDAG